MIKKAFKKVIMLMLIVLGLLILLNTSVYANSNNARYVMDAELLSNNNIAVLFIKGGTSGGNALTEYGMLYIGIYNPDDNSWNERLVGGRAKEGALAIYDDKAYIAYVTDNDLIGYIYQTDTGWSDVDFISSNDANGEGRANTLSGVDIAIDSNGFAHIVYVDSDGAVDDYYARDDGLYATNKSGSFVKTVVADCTGWFSSPDGYRTEMAKPIKITIDSEDNTFIAYKSSTWEKWMGGSDTSYSFEFKSNNSFSLGYDDGIRSGSSIIETCSDGTNFYTLTNIGGQYIVLNGNTKITESGNSFTATAIDMTLDKFNRLYYTAMNGNTILLYQNGVFVEDVQATTSISSHTRFATVVIGNAQYAIYTGTDVDTSLVISRIRYGQTSEFLVPNEIKTWAELQTALNNGGTVKLTQDLVADSGSYYLSIKENSNVTLDLNGYIIDRNLDDLTAGGEVIKVDENATLVITDSRPTATHSPEITYRDLTTNEDVVVNGGIITGGYSLGAAGGVYIASSANVTLNGGTIVGNKAKTNSQSGSAGGVDVHMSTFTMNGGAIVGNEAISGDSTGLTAGGVYLNAPRGNTTSFTMNGGTIAGNYSSNTNNNCIAGVYNYNATFNISGNSKITGNMLSGQKNNVVFSNEYNATVLNITSALTNEARIGISPWRVIGDNPLTITNGYKTYNNNQDPTKYFTLDTEGVALALDSNKEVKVATEYTVTLLENENGTINADKLKGISGTRVNISYVINDPTVYRFVGWEVVSGGVTISGFSFTFGTSDVVIKLLLEEIPLYTLYFEANGGTGTMDSVTQREGTTYVLPECAFTAPAGYEFRDWLVDPIDAIGGFYAPPGNTINVIYNNLITPRWKTIDYTITYDLNGGTVNQANPEGYTVESNNITLVNPTKDNYVFAGWIGTGLTEPTLEVTIPKGSVGNRSYTAVWATEYNLWVGNTRVMSTNANDVLKDGGSVVYNATTNTLTLNNTTINGGGDSERGYGIKYQGNTDLNIIANGNNVVRDNGTRTAASAGLLMGGDIGIYSGSVGFTTSDYTANLRITINKDATLTIAGGDTDGDSYPSSYGICMWQDRGNITIDGEGTLSARMGNSTYCYGIYPAEELIINSTGKIQVYGPNDTYYAIGMWAKKITINSGDIDVFPGHTQFASIAISTEGASYYGEEYGDIVINGGTVLAEGGRVPKNNGTNEFDKSKSYGIYADKDITINGCDLVRANTQATEADISIALNKAPILPEEMLAGANTESSDNNMVVYVPENNDTYKFFKVPYTKPQATVVSPIANVLTYNGENQNLIQPGSSTDGIIKYSLDGENFSEDIPQGKEAKDYTIYYKVIGDFNHNDSDIGSVVASIHYPDGLNYIDGTWYYYQNNKVKTDFTDLVYYGGNWYYIQNGVLKWGVETLVKHCGTWYYVKNSTLDWNFTDLFKYNGSWYYIQKGTLKWGVETLVKYCGTWYYVKNSTLDWNFTDLFKFNGSWYYIQKGTLKWGVETLVKHSGTWYYVKNSTLDWNFTDLFKYNGSWYYIQKGTLKWGVETLVQHCGTWYYVKNSTLDWNYTGLCNYNGKKYYIQKGVLKWGYNGTITYNEVKYNIKNSTVV